MKKPPFPDHRAPLLRVVFLASLPWWFAACSRQSESQTGDLVLSGNVEITDAQLGFKVPGRVVERGVSEGDRVDAGQLIARLDDAEQRETLALRRAEQSAAEAALADLEAGSRPQEIAAAGATVRSAQAELDRARLEFKRSQDLQGKEVISDRDFEVAQAQLKVAEAGVAEAGEHLKLLQAGARADTINQARARLEQTRASVALATTQLENTRLLSPLTGVVLSHNVEPGEYVSAGTPLATVAAIAPLWVRAYVNQTDLGRIHLGEKVAVRNDTFPEKSYDGTIAFIATEAEFTPKTVQTPKERVKLVFRIKVDVANPRDELKSGMPADVIIPAKP